MPKEEHEAKVGPISGRKAREFTENMSLFGKGLWQLRKL